MYHHFTNSEEFKISAETISIIHIPVEAGLLGMQTAFLFQ